MIDENQILDEVARVFHMTRRDLEGRRRTQHIAFARHVAMYLIRENTGMSFPTIGYVLNRDHSTVIHGCARIRHRVLADSSFAATIERIEDGILRPYVTPWEQRTEFERGCLA